jgi:hypothetical protein
MSYRLGIGNYVPSIPCATAKSGLPPALLLPGLTGLGCPSCNGTCGQHKGLLGLGIFDTGLDWTGWGIAEYVTIGLGLWALSSMFGSAKRTGRAVASLAPTKKGKSRRRRRARALKEAQEAGIL